MLGLIDDSTPNDILFPKSHPVNSTVPRDFTVQPAEMFAAPDKIKLIDPSEYDARIDEQERTQSSLEHMFRRKNMDVLDQNGQGYCWAYSVTMSVMLQRLVAGLGTQRLSGHAIGCQVMNYQDKGGWCGLSQEKIAKDGVPDVEHWIEKSMSRSNDTPAMRENALKYRITQDVVDLTRPVHSRNLTLPLIYTLLLQNIPVPTDWMFWGHSVCAARMVRIERGVYGIKGPNSWTSAWGDRGWFTINTAAKGAPMGAVATLATAA